MAENPYVPFYTSDFLAGTGGMTSATKGVYITLICLIYEAQGPTPQKYEALARRCGCTLPAFKRALQDLIDDGKIEITDAGLWSEKCAKHLTRRRERQSSASASAKKRWEKSKEKQGKGDANALQPQCERNANQNQNQNQNQSISASNEAHEAMQIFADQAKSSGWSVPQKLTDVRRRAIVARIKDAGGIEGWRVAIEKAAASGFISQSTFFGLDWMVKPANFTKLMEGNYDNRQNGAGSARDAARADTERQIFDAAARHRGSQEVDWL